MPKVAHALGSLASCPWLDRVVRGFLGGISLNALAACVIPGGLSGADRCSGGRIQCIKVFETLRRLGRIVGSSELWGEMTDFAPNGFFSSGPRINTDFEYQEFSRVTAAGLVEER